MTALYVPPTEESDHKKQNQSLQLIGGQTSTNTTNIATNTANIATNTTNITALQAQTAGYESAWTSYTPTVTAQTGTFTTVSATGRYKKIGKTVFVEAKITMTTVGTAAGYFSMTPPAVTAAAFDYCGVFFESGISSKSGGVVMINGFAGGNILGRAADGTTIIQNGAIVVISMTYEAA